MDDPRSRELGHLKLALATFALHLVAFEMQAQEAMLSIGKTGIPVRLVDIGRELGKDDLSGRQ